MNEASRDMKLTSIIRKIYAGNFGRLTDEESELLDRVLNGG